MPSLVKWGVDPSRVPAAVRASKEPIIRFFSFHDAHPVALTMVLMKEFGVEWLEWEPETLRSEILTAFQATSISEHNWNKIQAVRALTQAVGFWEEWQNFEKILQTLNNNVPRFDICQRCTMAQLMAGVDIANTVRKEEFSEEVQKYVAACAMDEGVMYLPDPLGFAQRILSRPMYKCLDCGAVDLDDLDGRCDFCTGRFQDRHPLNFKPAGHVPKDAGTRVERFLTRDPRAAEKKFNELRSSGWDNTKLSDESPADVQAGKLMVAYEYMRLRQKQLVEQLEELKTWVQR